jgi:hypothetical protein
VSESIAPPANVPVAVDPAADELMTDWLAERMKRAIEIVVAAAPPCGVRLKAVWVEGWKSYEEPTRELVVIPEIDASNDAADDDWGVLATEIDRLNQPPPAGAMNSDVTVQVSVRW